MIQRLPEWLTIRLPRPDTIKEVEAMMRTKSLHTVCESARCPNLPECWSKKTATFMILGNTCTRSCGYCNVIHGNPTAPDPLEPAHVASAIEAMELAHVVITSVDRDDLPDCGASHFARTITETRARIPKCSIEVLIPDFKGDDAALRTVLDAGPDILNHNIETVPRMYRLARPGGRYSRALELLDRSRQYAPAIPTKSGIMVGLGENWHEVVSTLRDLRQAGCQILTVGQYLRPSLANLPMSRYYTPAEFAELKRIGLDLGFGHVESGPLVRSSYHAHEQVQSLAAAR
jgi:lipoic acid synthetase